MPYRVPTVYWGNLILGVAFFAYLAAVTVNKGPSPGNASRILLDEDTVDLLFSKQAEGKITMEELQRSVRQLSTQRLLEAESEVLSPDDVDAIMQEQLTMASRISVFFSSVFFMMMAFYIIWSQSEGDIAVVKRSSLRVRLNYCIQVNLYICFFSCLFNTVQLMDEDDFTLGTVNHTLDLGRPIEWIMTCPLMQLCIPIIAGVKVPESRTTIMPLVSVTILVFGLVSALVEAMVIKFVCYLAGAAFFLVLCYLINECIRDANDQRESLSHGSSNIRMLSLIVVFTWIPFPIWYALSPEGFNVIQNSAAMKVVVAFLNVISKGTFTLYLTRIRDDQRLREKVLAERIGTRMDGKFEMPTNVVTIIQEALGKLGRGHDFEDVMSILQVNMITSAEDILVLTQPYCEDIGLPWSLVFAFRDQWRRMQVSNADAWQLGAEATDMQARSSPAPDFRAVSPAAPHVARNPEKLQRVLKQIGYGDDENRTQSGFGALAICDERTESRSSPGRVQLALNDKQPSVALNDRGALDVADVVREAEDRLESRMEEMVNARVMEVLHMNLKQHRGGMP
jgi:bacteriorhodopsin